MLSDRGERKVPRLRSGARSARLRPRRDLAAQGCRALRHEHDRYQGRFIPRQQLLVRQPAAFPLGGGRGWRGTSPLRDGEGFHCAKDRQELQCREVYVPASDARGANARCGGDFQTGGPSLRDGQSGGDRPSRSDGPPGWPVRTQRQETCLRTSHASPFRTAVRPRSLLLPPCLDKSPSSRRSSASFSHRPTSAESR